jgi:hypothetical protein
MLVSNRRAADAARMGNPENIALKTRTIAATPKDAAEKQYPAGRIWRGVFALFRKLAAPL